MAFPAFLSELFDALNHEMGQRFDALGRMIDDRFATVDRQFAVRDARFARLETKNKAEVVAASVASSLSRR